jgi:hypothetical protein
MRALLSLIAVLVTLVLVGCGDTNDESLTTVASADPSCPVGDERPVFAALPEPTGILLACGKLDGGRKVQLLADKGDSSCLQLIGVDRRVRECGIAPSEREPRFTRAIFAWAIAQVSSPAPIEIYGATSADVAHVQVQYASGGRSHQAPAELLRVTDPELLTKAQIGEPFGYFLGELPHSASKVTATALTTDGDSLGTASFDPILRSQHPEAFISGPSAYSSSASVESDGTAILRHCSAAEGVPGVDGLRCEEAQELRAGWPDLRTLSTSLEPCKRDGPGFDYRIEVSISCEQVARFVGEEFAPHPPGWFERKGGFTCRIEGLGGGGLGVGCTDGENWFIFKFA